MFNNFYCLQSQLFLRTNRNFFVNNEQINLFVMAFVLEIQLLIITFTRYVFKSVKSLVIHFCESNLSKFYNRLHHIMTLYKLLIVAAEISYKFMIPLLMKQVVQNKKLMHINHTEVSHTEILENHAVSGRHFSIHTNQFSHCKDGSSMLIRSIRTFNRFKMQKATRRPTDQAILHSPI